MFRCPKHKAYKGERPTKSGCGHCKLLYLARKLDKLGYSVNHLSRQQGQYFQAYI